MNNPWKQLSPKDPFTVLRAAPITNMDQETLIFLYQPIIGPIAFSLYMTLYSEMDDFEKQANHLHNELLNSLSIGLPHFYQARIRLEGIGLLKTFINKQSTEKSYLYQLQPPVSAAIFFKDDILSLLLLEIIGESRYKALVQRYAAKPIPDECSEITRSFLDVYSFHPDRLKSHEQILEGAKAKVEYSEGHVPKIPIHESKFDWDYFLATLNTLIIRKEQVSLTLKETILALHELYGIDELEMQDFLLRAVDVDTGQVTPMRLRQIVQRTYLQQHDRMRTIPDVAGQALEEQEQKSSLRQATLKLAGFKQKDIELITASETQPPMIFLANIKKQKGGFLAEDERWTLQKLQQQSGLPNSVINILLHYILYVQDNPSLSAKYANTIANDWKQSNIHTPEAAMQKVKELSYSRGKTPSKKTSFHKKGKANTIRKETLPDWAEASANSTAALDPAEEEYFKKRIKHLTERHQNEGGEA